MSPAPRTVGPVDRSRLKKWGPRATEVTLPAQAHVYDVRRGAYLGEKGKVTVALRPLEPIILALAPYRVAKLDLAVGADAIDQGRPLACTVAVKPVGPARPAEHVVRLEFVDPDGVPAAHYACNLAVQGVAVCEAPLALNGKVGRWTVVATDVATGVTARRHVRVVKPTK